jgi:transposase
VQPFGSELVILSNNWRVDTPVNKERYSKARTPAIDPSVHSVSVEDEAQGLARRIRASQGGHREHNLATLNAELRTLNRNIENGYPDPMWQFRINVIKRAEIARETGHDWRTVKRYLSAEASSSPPVPARRGRGARKIDPYAHLVDAWLAKQPKLKAVTIYERLVAEHGFDGHYQRVKVYVRENRDRVVAIPADPPGLHRRFEVLAGAQAQVDWGDEGEVQTATGPLHAYSFHMVLSYSRDPFCCFAASQDLGSFWDCHRRAFAHFGGVPAAIVYDRTKTVVRRHVGRGQATPLHPEAVAFASHYGVRDPAVRAAAAPSQRSGGSGRSRSSAATSWTVVSSTRLGRWTRPSQHGCRSGGQRCIAPTVRSSGCMPNAHTAAQCTLDTGTHDTASDTTGWRRWQAVGRPGPTRALATSNSTTWIPRCARAPGPAASPPTTGPWRGWRP